MSRIALVTLVVDDYDRAIAFYVGALGFALLEDTKLSDTKRWVRVAPRAADGTVGTGLLLARADGPRQAARIGDQTGGRVGFFLETDDFARDHAAFLAAGVDFRETPRVEPYGTVAVFADPFGTLWDLIEPARAAS
jgi:catechol 2,3-dioxygenase-like lactoylglutathione lyase family enzyme